MPTGDALTSRLDESALPAGQWTDPALHGHTSFSDPAEQATWPRYVSESHDGGLMSEATLDAATASESVAPSFETPLQSPALPADAPLTTAVEAEQSMSIADTEASDASADGVSASAAEALPLLPMQSLLDETAVDGASERLAVALPPPRGKVDKPSGDGKAKPAADVEPQEAQPLPAADPLPSAPLLPAPTLASQWFGADTVAAAVLGPPPAPQAEDGNALHDARERALRAHAELATAARARQARMLEDTSSVLDGLRRDHATIDGDVRSRHQQAVAISDQHATQQVADIDLAADRAERDLEAAHISARRAVGAAARRAEALIKQRIDDAGEAIADRVRDLKSGHATAYSGKVSDYRTLVKTATDALTTWKDGRDKTYKVDATIKPMKSAINEKLRVLIPGIADKRVTRLDKEKDERLKAWDDKNTQALCTTPCSYEAELRRQVTEKYNGGRSAVQTALNRARQRLKAMFDEAKSNLARQRQAARAQVFLHQRGLRAQLAGQSQATLAGVQRNAQGAIANVAAAARTAMPAYWQSLGSLKQALAAAAPAGAAALRTAAQESPMAILGGLDASAALARVRFDDGLRQADARAADQTTDLGERHHEQQRLGHATLTVAATEAAAAATQLVDDFREQAAGIVEPVRSAGSPYAATPEQLLGVQFDKAKVNAAAGLSAMFADSPASNAGGDAAGGCGSCSSAASGGGGGSAQAGIDRQIEEQGELLKPYANPDTEAEIAGLLANIAQEVLGDVTGRVDRAFNALKAGVIDKVDEPAVTAALRGMSIPRARAVNTKDYPEAPGKATLTLDLAAKMGVDDEDYIAAAHYLQGDQKAGAKAELAASRHWYNDQEARIESTLRALSPTDAQAIGEDPEIGPDIRDALGGTDREVYDALTLKDGGGAVKADAIRMKEKLVDARSDADKDAALSGIESSNAIRAEDYNGQQLANLDPEDRARAEQEHRTAVARELGKLVVADSGLLRKEAAGNAGDAAALDALHEREAVNFVRRGLVSTRYEPTPPGKDGRPVSGRWKSVPQKATADLAEALLLEGRSSVKAKAAQIGVELERPVRPSIDKLAETLHDDAFLPDLPGISDAERDQNDKARQQARARKAEVLLLAAEKYAGGEARKQADKPDDNSTADPALAAAQDLLVAKFGKRFGDRDYGKSRGDLVAGLIHEDRPSARTASLAMQVGMYADHGTDEALINGMTARMTASEIEAMELQFGKDTRSADYPHGKNLRSELDSEFSGDDRLENERNLRGLARTEKEKIEAAVFEIRQQRRETGRIGRALARGSNAEQVLDATERRLYRTLGVSAASFNAEGRLRGNAGLFDARGQFTGDGRGLLLATAGNTRAAVQAYSANIDRYANAATTSIAVIGAVAGAVLSGGTATPLIVAAFASGLTSMAASYAIKGGRYGWEQAGIDLGMTFVQAATAGIGQKLGAAAQLAKNGSEAVKAATRSLQVLSKLFGKNQVVNQITIGAITGTFGSSANLIGGMAGTAFDDKTWSKSGDEIVLALFGGLARGALSGASTASMTQAIEALGRRGEVIANGATALWKQGGLVGRTAGAGGYLLGAGAKFVNTGLKRETGGGFFKGLGALGHRGLAKAGTAGLSGMAGRSSELLYDEATGKFKGRFDDALEEIGKAGLQNAIQGFGEGGAEAGNQQWRGGQKAKLGEQIAEERRRRGLDALDPVDMQAAQDELLLLNLHGKAGDGYEAQVDNLDRVAAHGGLDTRRVGDVDNAPDLDVLRERLTRDLPEHARKALKDVPIRIADDGAPFARIDSDRTLAALPGLGRDDALLRHVDGGVELVLRTGIGMREVARAGRNLAQAHADGTVQGLIDRNAVPAPSDTGAGDSTADHLPPMLPGGGVLLPASAFIPSPDADPAPAASAAEQAIARDALLLRSIGYDGDRGSPGRAQARTRLDRSLRTLKQFNRQHSAGGPLTGAATMRERLRVVWQRQAVFGAAGRARLSVIGELAAGSSPRMRALLGADGAMADAAARSLLAQYGDAAKLIQLLAIADPHLTPNLNAAAARLGDYRKRLAQSLGSAFGAQAPAGRVRPGDAIDLEFPGADGAARRADAAERMAEQFGPDWQKHFDIAFIDGPGKPKPAPAVEVADDPLSVPLPQEAAQKAARAARAAADAAGLPPPPPSIDGPGHDAPTAAGTTDPKVQRAIIDTIVDLRLGTVLSLKSIGRYFSRHKDNAIARAAAADPLAADFGGAVVAARLKEAWNKQAMSGKDGRRRLAVVQELAMASGERARALLGSDAEAADAAALSVLKDYGSYEHLMAMLSVGGRELTPAMQACAERILAFRSRITGALGRAYGAAELGSASKFLNSDVDLSFAGDDAGARLLAAEARMAEAYGADWEKMLTMNFYVEASRLTAFHDGPDSANRSAAADALTDKTLQAVIGRVLSDVHGNADGVTAVGKMAGLLGVDLDAAAARPDLDREGYKAKRKAALLAADEAVKQLRTATTPEQAAELRLKITALTMQANRYSTEAYIGPGAVLLTLKSGGKVTPDLALQSFVGDFENFVHKLYGHGRTVDDGLRDYTTFKYMGRMIEALHAGGVRDPRMAYFEGLAGYLYGGNREGGFESAHLFANPEIYASGKGKAQLSDLPQEGGRSGAVRPEFLHADLARFMALITDLAPQLRSRVGQHFDPTQDLPDPQGPGQGPANGPKPNLDAPAERAFAAEKALPKVIVNLPGQPSTSESEATPPAAKAPMTAAEASAEKAKAATAKSQAVTALAKASALPVEFGPATEQQAALATRAAAVADEAKQAGEAAVKRAAVIARFVELGLDPAAIETLPDHAYGGAFTALGNATMGAPRPADSSGPLPPTADQKRAAQWAWSRAGGDLGKFASHYEYAVQHYRRIGKRQTEAAGEVADKTFSQHSLDAGLAADVARVAARPRAKALSGPVAALSDQAIHQRLRQVDTLDFADPVKEAYHALKHADEIPADFKGSGTIETHHRILMDTIRTGTLMELADSLQASGSRKIVIHKRFGDGPADWREAILYVWPDGRVHLASWGETKAIKVNKRIGRVKDSELNKLVPAQAAALRERYAAEDVIAEAAKKDKQRQDSQAKQAQKAKPGGQQQAKSDQAGKDQQTAKGNQNLKRDKNKKDEGD